MTVETQTKEMQETGGLAHGEVELPAEPAPSAEPGFAGLGLSDRSLEAVERVGYDRPTPIQRQAIPPALQGRDVLGSAQTGSGKTAAFVLPMVERLAGGPEGVVRGLVVTPTRELARQVERAASRYAATSALETLVLHGGTPLGPDFEALEWGCDIVVATPGRLLDHVGRGTADLSRVQVLVLDEADRMLDMGFIDDVRKIVAATPGDRQTFLFSATMPNRVRSLAHDIMRDPVRVQVDPERAATGIRQVVHPVDSQEKHTLLLHLLRERTAGQVLVFTRTRATASYLADYLERHEISVQALHGGRTQAERTRSLERFREGEIRVLVATNVAARGLDIRGIRHVVNFDVPRDPRDYVHRVGRTARADETGDAVTLMSPHEWLLVRDVERLMETSIERRSVEGFEPSVEPLAERAASSEEGDERPRSALKRGRRRR